MTYLLRTFFPLATVVLGLSAFVAPLVGAIASHRSAALRAETVTLSQAKPAAAIARDAR